MAIKNIYDTEISAPSFTWNGNTIATQAWVNANVGTPTLDAVTTAGNVTTNNIGVGLIELGGDSEHRLYRATTSLIKGTATDTTILTGRTVDLYAYDDINIRAGSSDNISFTAGGVSNAMYINSAGNVGIGTTSPSAKLEVAGAVKVTDSASGVTIGGVGHASLRLDRASTSYDNNILFNTNGDTKFRIWQDGDADYLYIRDDDNAANMVTFKKGGGVGIGTTNMYARLNVRATSHNNGISVNRQADNTAAIYIGNDGGSNPILAANNADMLFGRDLSGTFTEHMRLTNGGNLGIGTTTPSYKLHVAGDTYTTGIINTRPNDYGILSKYGSEGLSYQPLENSSAQVRYWLRFDYTNNGSYPYLTNRTPSGDVVIKTGIAAGGGENEHFRIKGGDGTVNAYFTNANVGIGTASPSVQLDIEDSGNVLIDLNTTTANANTTIRFQEAGANTATIGYDGTNNGLILTTGSFTANSGIFVNDSGNVGIHTANPSVDLQTGASGASLDTAIRAYHSDGAYTEIRGYGLVTNRTTAYIRPTGDKNAVMAIGNDGNTWNYVNVNANYFTVGTDTTEHMRITSAGNVGIGTTSPASKLTVVDAGNTLTFSQHSTSNVAELKIIADAAHDAAFYFGDTVDNVRGGFYYDTSANQLQVRGYNNGTRMVVNSNGNVGIGTTSPNNSLDVSGSTTGQVAIEVTNNTTTTGTSRIILNSNSDTNGNGFHIINNANNGVVNLLNYKNTDLALWTNAAERMRITAGGNVGIGTTSPQQKLHIEGNIYMGPNNTNNFIHSGAALGLQADGEVKIVSDVNDTSGGGGSDIIFGYGSSTNTDSNQDFTEAELGTYPRVEVMRIDASTNSVGIGTTSPSEKLEVSGNILASGDITAFSDARLKENVETLPNALESVKAMRGVTYNKIGDEKQSIGVIAQEVQAVLPQLVSEHKDEMLSVAYGNITAVLIEAIKEQQEQIDELKAIINGLTK